MPSAQAQAHNSEEGFPAEGAVPPLLLADVDDLLLESARAARAGSTAPVRAWRNELTEALAVLTYAETVLSGDAALLRHCLATGPFDHKQVLDGLGRVVAGEGVSDAAAGLPDDDTVFARADRMLSVHERMAGADLTRRQGVRRLLDDVELELGEVTARRLQVDARLANIRAAVIRQYREGKVPAPESWLR
jgi:hypothetical protein